MRMLIKEVTLLGNCTICQNCPQTVSLKTLRYGHLYTDDVKHSCPVWEHYVNSLWENALTRCPCYTTDQKQICHQKHVICKLSYDFHKYFHFTVKLNRYIPISEWCKWQVKLKYSYEKGVCSSIGIIIIYKIIIYKDIVLYLDTNFFSSLAF